MARPGGAGQALGVLRRLGWGVADQGISSLSNFAVSAVVARELGANRFGAFTLAYVTYSLIINGSRGLATDPLLVRFSGERTSAWRRAVGGATATAVGVGVLSGLACIVVGLLLPNNVRGGFIALGVGLPGLMLQDSWRFAFFSVGQGLKALINDVVWTVLLLAVLGLLIVTSRATVVSCVLAFGGTATLAAAFGMLQSRIRPQPFAVRWWLRETRSLGLRYLTENLAIGGARQLRVFAVGAFAGLAAVGDVRSAEILMGPFLVVLMGVSQVAVPEASHVLSRAPRRLLSFCFGLGAVQAIAACLWGVLVAVLLPERVGVALIGSLWTPASSLLIIVAIGMALACFSIGATAGLRAMAAAPRSLAAQLTASILYVVGGATGAAVGGARGSCWGVLIATAIGAMVWWAQLYRTLADHLDGRGAAESNNLPSTAVAQ